MSSVFRGGARPSAHVLSNGTRRGGTAVLEHYYSE